MNTHRTGFRVKLPPISWKSLGMVYDGIGSTTGTDWNPVSAFFGLLSLIIKRNQTWMSWFINNLIIYCITLHYITLHYITLHNIALHTYNILSICIYIYICVFLYYTYSIYLYIYILLLFVIIIGCSFTKLPLAPSMAWFLWKVTGCTSWTWAVLAWRQCYHDGWWGGRGYSLVS